MSAVVLIHGIWMTGIDMSLLRYRLRKSGFNTKQFSYPSVRCDLQQNAQHLQRFISNIDDDEIHFVCHSLGGLLIRQLFVDFPEQKPGRVVTLSTPHQGSVVAKRMKTSVWSKVLLGKSLDFGLLGNLPAWTSANEIGVIAGNRSMGIGRFVTRLPGPNDGTVTLEESRLEGMKDYKILPVTHAGMMLSPQVAKEVRQFLDTGMFFK